jgi:hypothetical protein
MAAQLRFNNGSGEQTLTSASSLARFNRWRPDPRPIGEAAHAVGDGVGYRWRHRTDYSVSFEFPLIANTDEAVLQQFLEWVNNFGAFSIDTGDSESNSYEQCQIAPGTEATISDPDPETLEYTLSIKAINIAASPVAMRRIY